MFSRRRLKGGAGRTALIAVTAAAVVAATTGIVPAAAQATNVSISEIHYNPASVGTAFPDYDDRSDAEFIELTNWGNASVDIGGWCINGIDFCFAPGATMSGGQILVGARDGAVLADVSGVTADFEYDGKLSNNSETLTITDEAGAPVDRVAYASRGLWPVTPDGLGPSLERIVVGSAESGPQAWAASSSDGGTPGSENSAEGSALPPLVTDHGVPANIAPGNATTVTATIVGASSATLEYRVNFDSTDDTAMTESNGTWTASIPGASAGDLVRYRIIASGAGGDRSGPRPDDTIGWWGYVVEDSVSTNINKLQWFATDADFNAVYGNPYSNTPCDGGLCPAVVALDGMVWDSVGFRAAGLTSRGHAKKNYRLDFPQGHGFEASFLDGPVDVITLDAQSPNYEAIREKVSWEFMAEQGLPEIQTSHGHLRKNGEFFGLYLLREEQDGQWRSQNGFDEGSMYKFEAFGAKRGWHGTWQKSEGFDVDFSLLDTLRDCLNGSLATRRECLPQQLDIPQVVNELAAILATRQIDQREFNWHIWHDTTGTGLWQLFPDDLDRSWGDSLTNPVIWFEFPMRRCFGLDNTPGNEICTAVMGVPEFEAMVYRRLRSMADGTMSDPKWPARVNELGALIADDWELDEALHNRTSVAHSTAVEALAGWMPEYAEHVKGGGFNDKVPAAQAPAPTIEIDAIRQNDGDGLEYVRLMNPGNAYVDVSDWRIDGLSPLPKGSVVPPSGSLTAVVNETAFSAVGNNDQELRAQVSGSVGPVVQLLRADASLADEAGFVPDSPVHLNEWNAVEPDKMLADGDPFFGQVAGNGGDWFELVIAADHTDLRGWKLVLSGEAGAGRAVEDVLVFANHDRLSDLRAGTIITVSESLIDDVSFSPLDFDWTLNFQAADGAPGAFFTPASQQNFDTHADDWQLAIVNPAGDVMFGPAGEGASGVSGVKTDEVGELDADPAIGIGPASGFDDGDASTFGAPNVSAQVPQNFGPLRAWFADVDGSGVIDLADVQAILDASTGVVVPAKPAAADVNLDGAVDLLDALSLAQFLSQ